MNLVIEIIKQLNRDRQFRYSDPLFNRFPKILRETVSKWENKLINEGKLVLNDGRLLINARKLVINEESRLINDGKLVNNGERLLNNEGKRVLNEESKVINEESLLNNEENWSSLAKVCLSMKKDGSSFGKTPYHSNLLIREKLPLIGIPGIKITATFTFKPILITNKSNLLTLNF
jgi:hypothetical protein